MSEVPEGFPRLDKVTRPWACKAGNVECTRAKPCARCRGARNRRSGMRKQRDARKQLEQITGTFAARFAGQLGNEEAWSGLPVRVEVKSGAQTKPAATRFLAAEQQSETSRPHGDTRPFVCVLSPPNWTDPLVIVRMSNLSAVAAAVLEAD